MLHCSPAFVVFALLPLVTQANDDSPPPAKAVIPLKASAPLIPLEQIDGPLPLDFVVAKLGGESITLLELGTSASSVAAMRKVQESLEPYRLRQIQEDLIETHLAYYLKNRLLLWHCKRELSEEQSARLDKWLSFQSDAKLQQLMQEYNAESIEELEASLGLRGLKSLSELQQDYENQFIIKKYWDGLGHEATRERIEEMFHDAESQSVLELTRVIRILGL